MKILVHAIAALVLLSGTQRVFATAVNFQEPSDWNVGDPDSTFQEWEADPEDFPGDPDFFFFIPTGTAPSSSSANPAISSDSMLGAVPPGNTSSSGGFYSFNGDYGTFADVLNHGGASGSGGPYNSNHGTRVIVQVAASMNTDPNAGGPASIFADTLELVAPGGGALVGGDNLSALSITDVTDPNFIIPNPFLGGTAVVQELVFEFWLPSYTGDFRVQSDSIVHSSFQHLRVDTLIVEQGPDADFDADGLTDGLDFLVWQADPNSFGNGDGLADWENSYGQTALIGLVPEPGAISISIAGLICGTAKRGKR